MNNPVTPPRPTSAGIYDFYLGGTAHGPADRAAAEQILQILPEVADTASANRGFLQRAVRWLADARGIRQFLDIGSGLPTQRNTHDVVAQVAPDSRVVYVDVDPTVVTMSGKMLDGVDNATVIQGDVRDPEGILAHPETRRLLDLTAPVGLLMVAVLHFVPDDDDPWALVGRYLDGLSSGSYLALTHGCGDNTPERIREAVLQVYANTSNPPTDRTRTEIERFFAGLEIVPPHDGAAPTLTFGGLWGADDPVAADSEGARMIYAAVARKP